MAPIAIPPLITPVAKPLTMPRKHPVLLDPSCVVYHDFSRGPKLYDYSGNGKHGTIIGATYVAKGRHGPALSFDKIDDYVIRQGPESEFIATAITMEVWLLANDPSDRQTILFKNGPYALSINGGVIGNATGMLFDKVGGGVEWHMFTGTKTISSGKWHYIVLAYDQVNILIYVDGKIDNAVSETRNIALSDQELYYGIRNKTTYPLDGLIDTVRIHNRALTANEIERIYEAEK